MVPALRGCRHDKTEPLKEAITTQCDGTTGSEFKALEAWRRVPEPSLEHGEGCETRESRGGGGSGAGPPWLFGDSRSKGVIVTVTRSS